MKTTASPPHFHYGWIVLIMGTLVVFGVLGLARFGYTLLLPSMQASLGLDNTQAGVLASANVFGYLALSLIGGMLAARYGPRKVIAVGVALVGGGMALTGLAQGFLPAAVWRLLTGLGSGASNVPVMGLMTAWFAAKRRGLASGVVVSGSSLAIILIGPTVPHILAANGENGWRVTWVIFGGVTLALAALAWLLLRDHPGDKGLGPLGDDSDAPPLPRPARQPVEWRRVYRSGAVWHLGLVYAAFGFSYIIYITFFTKYLIAEAGYTQGAAGSLFMTMGWFSLLCGLLWGTISDVSGRKLALMGVYLFHAIAFSLFALWPTRTGLTVSAVLFGLSAWSIPAIMTAACGDLLGSRLAPAALGFLTLFFGIGQALGPGVAGAIADAIGSFAPAFLLAGGVSILGLIGSFLLRPAAAVQDA